VKRDHKRGRHQLLRQTANVLQELRRRRGRSRETVDSDERVRPALGERGAELRKTDLRDAERARSAASNA
jgi:hypothetical protein